MHDTHLTQDDPFAVSTNPDVVQDDYHAPEQKQEVVGQRVVETIDVSEEELGVLRRTMSRDSVNSMTEVPMTSSTEEDGDGTIVSNMDGGKMEANDQIAEPTTQKMHYK